MKRLQARYQWVYREEFKFARDVVRRSSLRQGFKSPQSGGEAQAADGFCQTSKCRMPGGAGSVSVAGQKHRGDAAQMADLNSGLDAARASGEMKVDDCQIGIYPIVKNLYGPHGVNSATDDSVAKLCQEHLQSKINQIVILNNQDPHLSTTIRGERFDNL